MEYNTQVALIVVFINAIILFALTIVLYITVCPTEMGEKRKLLLHSTLYETDEEPRSVV
jgi:hypothetical protein